LSLGEAGHCEVLGREGRDELGELGDSVGVAVDIVPIDEAFADEVVGDAVEKGDDDGSEMAVPGSADRFEVGRQRKKPEEEQSFQS